GRLRESGLALSIDDFGTGFSSLAYLNDLPVDEVKIDRSFIAGLPGKQRNRSIVRATIAMAHELGLAVVAEGVDDEAVMRILREDRCDRAQGFLIAEPLPEAQFLEFFADNRRRSARARTGGGPSDRFEPRQKRGRAAPRRRRLEQPTEGRGAARPNQAGAQ